MKVLVTGGAGFIGSHLVSRLCADGHEVIVLDKLLRGNKLPREVLEKVDFHEGDVLDEALVRSLMKGCDTVFHFAAILGVDVVADNPVETMDTEVVGTRNVARAAIAAGTSRLVYASTSGIYGKIAIESAVSEDFQVAPASSYAIAKRYNEIYLKSVSQETGLSTVSIRFFNVYGPRQDARMVIPRFFEQALRNQAVTVFGDGRQTRDFTFVDDVIESTIRLSRSRYAGEIFNVSNDHEHSIGELAREIVRRCGRGEVMLVSPPEGRYDFEVSRRRGSSEKLEKATGFRPSTPLEEGLAAFKNWLDAGN